MSTETGHYAAGHSPGSDPHGNLIHDALEDVLLRHAERLWNLKRMITAFDPVKRCGEVKSLDDRANLFCRSKRIACALHEKHRRLNVLKMRIAQLIESA